MRIKNKWIVSIGLVIICVASIMTGNAPIAAAAVGGLVGWLAGEKNGEEEDY